MGFIVEDPSDDTPMCEVKPKAISFERRKQLLALAVQLSETVHSKTERHEMYALRRMMDCLIERD